MVRCKTQQRTCVTRNVMVSANVPNRAAAKRSNALTYGEATMVSANVPNRAAAKLSSAPVLRETVWFLPMSRTGLPQYAYP